MRNQIDCRADYISDVKADKFFVVRNVQENAVGSGSEARLRLFSGRIAVAGVSSAGKLVLEFVNKHLQFLLAAVWDSQALLHLFKSGATGRDVNGLCISTQHHTAILGNGNRKGDPLQSRVRSFSGRGIGCQVCARQVSWPARVARAGRQPESVPGLCAAGCMERGADGKNGQGLGFESRGMASGEGSSEVDDGHLGPVYGSPFACAFAAESPGDGHKNTWRWRPVHRERDERIGHGVSSSSLPRTAGHGTGALRKRQG